MPTNPKTPPGSGSTVVEEGGDLQAAWDALPAGGTLVIRGHHPMNVSLKLRNSASRCSAEKPCHIVGEGATLDGSIELEKISRGDWIQTDRARNQWKVHVSHAVSQLWMDGKPLTSARYPNQEVWSPDFWKKSRGFFRAAKAGNGWMEDPKHIPNSLLQPLRGCKIVMNSGSWGSFTKTITKHQNNRIEYRRFFDKRHYLVNKPSSFIECASLMDQPFEWFYRAAYVDRTSIFGVASKDGYVNVQLPEGETPQGKAFRGRITTKPLLEARKAKYIEIRDLIFFAGFPTMGSSRDLTIQGCTLLFPHSSKRAIGYSSRPETMSAHSAINFVFRDNVVKYSDGMLMNIGGTKGAAIENNLFYMIDYAVIQDSAGVTLEALHTSGLKYRFNTLDTAGSSDNIRFGARSASSRKIADLSMNYHTHCGLTQEDGATIQVAANDAYKIGPWNAFFHHNWFVHTRRGGLRFDGSEAGRCGVVYKNLAYHCEEAWGFRLKGDFHKVFNNLAIGTTRTGASRQDLSISSDKGPCENKGCKSNVHTLARNNVAEFYNVDAKHIGNTSHNYVGRGRRKTPVVELLRDVKNYDFRPRSLVKLRGSSSLEKNPLVDEGEVVNSIQLCGKAWSSRPKWGRYYTHAGPPEEVPVASQFNGDAPDLGPYELDVDASKDYWIPGRREKKPSHPIPTDRNAAFADTDLMWRPACAQMPACLDDPQAGIKEYQIFLVCGDGSLEKIGATKNNIFSPGSSFPAGSVCRWRVDTVLTSGGVVEGDEWNFNPSKGSIND
jgi:hypothetical protein